jgi:hypothetical protein
LTVQGTSSQTKRDQEPLFEGETHVDDIADQSSQRVEIEEPDSRSDTLQPAPVIYDGIHKNTRLAIDTRMAARRLRRNLKESGDYLGVQGINPLTGELDVLTPTSSSPSDLVPGTSTGLEKLLKTVKEAKFSHEETKKTQEALEEARREIEKLNRAVEKKESIRILQRRVRWRREGNNWSSVAEPDLSPIQSLRSGISGE